jgi:flagellar assembly factor FliW
MPTLIDQTTKEPSTKTARQVRFVEPLPGFPDLEAFTLSAIDDRGLLYSLRAVDDPTLRFVLAPPEGFYGDYYPEIADEIGETLGASEVEVLVMVTVPSGLHDATANLRAPIVVAPTTGCAMQVILDDETLSMRRPLLTTQIN